MWILATIILTICLSVSVWMCILAYKKISVYEKWIYDTANSIHSTWDQMRELDNKEMFEKDDEVGVIFSELKSLIDDLNEKVEKDIYASEENDEAND